MKNVLIYGGFNWIGYELTDTFIRGNMVTNIVIVDIMKNHLYKDNIKAKFDNYAHLYDENVFLYVVDFKDKDKLLEIYRNHNINIVINNIKYNIYDTPSQKEDIELGYNNIKDIHQELDISNYVYITRQYTHDSVLLNNQCRNITEDCLLFNENMYKISNTIGTEILIPDYVFGDKKDKYNDIVMKMYNILRAGSSLFVREDKFYCLYDVDLLIHIIRVVFYREIETSLEERVDGPYDYCTIIDGLKKKEICEPDECKLKEYILSFT